MYKAKLAMKSGAILEAVVGDFSIQENVYGVTVGYKWTNVEGQPRLFDVVIDEVAAIVLEPFDA